jgi:hypothetical protein
MHLKRIALKHANEPMEAWDLATETWVPNALLARIDLTDRFLSNFNRPTRMRMMFHADDAVLPPSMTVRHPGTLDVYMLGTTRKDARKGQPYVGLTLCRLATDVPGGTAGYATITRKAPQGPASDPGWLVETLFAKSWMDTEFLSSADEVGATDLRIERYNAFLPLAVQPQEWDFVTMHGVKYRVIDTFADSGLFALRLDHEADLRRDFVLTVAGTRTMDHGTHEYVVTPEQSYNVTGVIESEGDVAIWAKDTNEVITVYFDADHFPSGVPALTGRDMWLTIDGKRRTVKQMQTQSGRRQYQLRCL